MNNKVVTSKRFNTKFVKLAKKRPQIISLLFSAAILLNSDHEAVSLNIHKLSGKLKERWAFSLTYELRIIFKWEDDKVKLLDIRYHDDVY